MVDEDLEPLITRCPNCVTQFRVTENQLAAASGRVRCGACLTVFQGIDHLILDEESTFASGSEADAALDALLDELSSDDPASDADTAPQSEDTPADSDGERVLESLPMDTFEPSRQLYGGFEDDPEEDSAVSDQEEAPATDHPLMASLNAEAATDLETPAAEAQISDAESVRPPLPEPVNQAPVDTHGPAETLEEDRLEKDYEKWMAPAAESIEQLVDEVVASGRPAADDLSPADEAIASSVDQAVAQPAADDGFHLSAVENALEEQGVGVRPILFAPEPRRWWVGGVAAMLSVLLIGQFYFLNLPEWSKDPDLRGSYVWFCGLFGCELPEMRSLESLRTRNLVVRSHPELQRTLIIDAVIVNQARYPQRFPDLALKFTAVDGLLVAGRLFRPMEYLGGELSQDDLMPSRTPVQISLEIDDPGKEAVNYTLSFH